MSLRLATFNVENLMTRFDFTGFRNQLRQDRVIQLFEVRNEGVYQLLEQARVIASTDDTRQMTALAIADAVAREYLDPVRARGSDAMPDSVVLGCTHFPLLAEPIRRAIGEGPTIVDSATTTAEEVATVLARMGLLRQSEQPGATTLLATDGAERFAKVGARFLGHPLSASDVEVVDL